MAAVITRKERTRRIWTLVVCGFFSLMGIILGVVSMIKVSDLEKDPETPDNLAEITARIEEIEPRIPPLKQTIADFSDWFRSHHYGNDSQSRMNAQPVQNDAIKDLLDLWGGQMKDEKHHPRDSVFQNPPAYDPYFTTKAQKEKIWVWRTPVKEWDPENEVWVWTHAGGEFVDDEIETDQVRVPAGGSTGRLWLTELKKMAVAQSKSYDQARAQHKREAEASRNAEVDAMTAIRTEDKSKSDEIPPVIKNLERLQDAFRAQEDEHFRDLQSLEEQLEEERRRYQKTLVDNAAEKAPLVKQISDYKHSIRHIKHRIEEADNRKEPDGYLIHYNPTDETVRVNLTKDDKVFNFMKFRVYRIDRGGELVDKGTITIVELGEHYSIGLVDFMNKAHPFKPGDTIYNVRYDKKQPNYFVIAGKLTKFSRVEVEHKLLEYGDVYQEKMDNLTTYCIAGDGYEDDPIYHQALERGVRVFAERYLYGYCGFPQ